MSAQNPFSDNPFAAPETMSDAAYGAQSGQPVYAGFLTRFAAAFVDGIILNILGFAMGAAVGIALGGDQMAQIVAQVMGVIVGWLYNALLESSESQGSLGKMALGIKVVDLQGQRISFGRASGRHFAKIPSILILGIGFIMAAFTEKKQALHDIMAGCLVVKKGGSR